MNVFKEIVLVIILATITYYFSMIKTRKNNEHLEKSLNDVYFPLAQGIKKLGDNPSTGDIIDYMKNAEEIISKNEIHVFPPTLRELEVLCCTNKSNKRKVKAMYKRLKKYFEKHIIITEKPCIC